MVPERYDVTCEELSPHHQSLYRKIKADNSSTNDAEENEFQHFIIRKIAHFLSNLLYLLFSWIESKRNSQKT